MLSCASKYSAYFFSKIYTKRAYIRPDNFLYLFSFTNAGGKCVPLRLSLSVLFVLQLLNMFT